MAESESIPTVVHSPSNRRLPPASMGSSRDLIRDPLKYFTNITREYGDIVCYRSSPEPAYLINHPNFVRHVLIDKQRNYNKATFSHQIFKKLLGDGLITAEGDIWKQQRRMMQPAFHRNRIERLDELFVGTTQTMLNRWDTSYKQGLPVDIAREMASLTLTITAHALFGFDLGEGAGAIGEIVNRVATSFEKPSNPDVIQAHQEWNAVVDEIIRRRRHNFQDIGDLLSSLMLARDEETGQMMTDEQLRNQLTGLLLAGYETTANTLTWTWYLLSQNQWATERLRAEIRKVLGDRLPTYADLANLPYARMLIDESLRLYPPAWMLGRRAIEEDEIGGYYVAPQTVIAISIYTLHRHPSFWDDPETFNPDRFAPEKSAEHHKLAYIPFGAGPRQCIGNTFGLVEASLVIACVAQRYELRLMPGIEVKAQPLYVLRPNRDILLSLHH